MDAAQKKTVIEAHAKHEGDTGSPEVQVRLMTLGQFCLSFSGMRGVL